MNFKLSVVVSNTVIFAVCMVMFRPALKAQFGDVGEIASLMPILALILLMPLFRIGSHQILLMITPLYFLGLGVAHSLSIYKGNFLPVLAGLYSIVLPYFFWLFVIRLSGLNREKIDLFLLYFALMNVFGALVFFFYDPLVFGWVGESIYSDAKKMAGGNVELRARTFIGTPQTIGVYSAVMLFAAYSNRMISPTFKTISIILLFIMGLLSGSKSFYLSLVAIIFSYTMFRGLRLRYMLAFLCAPILLILSKDLNGIFGRIVGVLSYLETGIENHATYIAWAKVLNYMMDSGGILFGYGLGALSRSGQVYYTHDLLFTTAESFILQVLFEAGIVGLLILLSSIAYLLICNLKNKGHANFAIGVGIFVNMFISPSFYGTAFGFLGYYYLFSSQYRSTKGK